MATRKPSRNGNRNGNSVIPFDGDKPEFEELKLNVNKRFNARLAHYARHYKEATGRDCDLGILVADIVNKGLSTDDAFVQKENSAHFDTTPENGARPAARTQTESQPRT